jgi:hypothetical protein
MGCARSISGQNILRYRRNDAFQGDRLTLTIDNCKVFTDEMHMLNMQANSRLENYLSCYRYSYFKPVYGRPVSLVHELKSYPLLTSAYMTDLFCFAFR